MDGTDDADPSDVMLNDPQRPMYNIPIVISLDGASDTSALQAALAFADMVADTERLGLYDAESAQVKAALKAARSHAEG